MKLLAILEGNRSPNQRGVTLEPGEVHELRLCMPPGTVVTINAKLTHVDGRRLVFEVAEKLAA